MTDLDNFILAMVDDRAPIKNSDLANEVAQHQHGVTSTDIEQSIDRLVRNEKIIEVEYVLPKMQNRPKSLFFPKGTKIGRSL